MPQFFIATGKSLLKLSQVTSAWEVSSHLDGKSVQCLATDPRDGNTVYAGSFREGLWKSEDAAQTWRDCRLPESAVFSIALSPADGAVYAGTEPSALFKSLDGGESWQELEALKSIPSAPSWSFPPRPHTSHVRWIAPNPVDPNLLLVGIELGGVMLSSDGGQSWLDHRPGAEKDAHELAWHPVETQRAYQAAGGGATWSLDGGQSWQALNAGKNKYYTWALAIDPDQPDSWYCSAASGAYAAHYYDNKANASVYRWKGEGPWHPLSELGKSNAVMPYSMQMLGGVLYVGFSDGEIWSSPDEGEIWRQLPIAEPGIDCIMQMRVLP